MSAHIPLDESYAGVHFESRSPDVVVVDAFLSSSECDELVAEGKSVELEESPVVYAGWSEDAADLIKTWASGPAAWIALGAVLLQANLGGVTDRLALAETAVGAYVANLAAAGLGVFAYVQQRERSLQALRTSKSVALRSPSPCAAEVAAFSKLTELLPGVGLERCEALTLIKYDAGDRLAPHYDANRAAEDEDAYRGGQTLCTVLVYLNDVPRGGKTRFTKLGLDVVPKRGDACVFFPADAAGTFDDRLEHEGETADAEKWIARVWVHAKPILGPAGVPDATIAKVAAAAATSAEPLHS